MMKAEKLPELCATCLASLRSLDGSGGGLLKVAEFNEALRGLTEEERQVGIRGQNFVFLDAFNTTPAQLQLTPAHRQHTFKNF